MTTTARDTFEHTVTPVADHWGGRTVPVRRITVGAAELELEPTRHGVWLTITRDDESIAVFLLPEQAPELSRMATLAAVDQAGM